MKEQTFDVLMFFWTNNGCSCFNFRPWYDNDGKIVDTMQLDIALQKCGLTFKEARVYLAALEIGPARTLAIAQRAHLKRTSCYEILKKLVGRGIAASQTRNRRQYFFVANPEKLKNIIQEQNSIIQQITPLILEQFHRRKKRIKMQMFEGIDGIKEIFWDTLSCKDKKILQYTSVQKFLKLPGKAFMHKYVRERVKRGIMNYALMPNSRKEDTGGLFGSTSERYLREGRYSDLFFTNFICIYDYKVAMASTERENFGFIIESEEFSRTIRDWFWFLWQFAKEKPDKR